MGERFGCNGLSWKSRLHNSNFKAFIIINYNRTFSLKLKLNYTDRFFFFSPFLDKNLINFFIQIKTKTTILYNNEKKKHQAQMSFQTLLFFIITMFD